MLPRSLCIAVFLLAAPAAAQSVLGVTEADSDSVVYGNDAAILGDTNGDGVADYAVGATPGSHVYVHDGADSSVLLDIVAAPLASDHVLDGADLDGDGLADIAAGYPGLDKVRFFRGLDGVQLATWSNVPLSGLTIVGDVDADGVPDLLCRGPELTQQGYAGVAQLRSGATSEVLSEHLDAASSFFPTAGLAGVGDVDGDGVPDYAIGSPGDSSLAEDGGAVDLRSGADGSLLWHTAGTKKKHELGWHLAPMGDVNLDGVPDLAASAPGPNAVGYVLVLSGADGSGITGIHDSTGSAYFGHRLAGTGDVTGDGHPDLLVSMSFFGQGRVDLFDGASAGTVSTFTVSTPLAGLIHGLDSGADLNGDGYADFVSTWWPWGEPGRALLVSTVDLPWEHLGQALAGTEGKPLLRSEGSLVAGTPITLRIAQALPLAPAWLVVGLSSIDAPFKGGVMVPELDLLLTSGTDNLGKLVLTATWPAGLPAGLNLFLQAWIADAGGPLGWSATNALLAEVP